MPTICMFRGIKVYINWREHQPPHFHATYGGQEVLVSIEDLEVIDGEIPNKQLKCSWAGLLFIKRNCLRIGSLQRGTKNCLLLSR